MSRIFTTINNSFDKLNNSKLFAGVIMILLNLKAKVHVEKQVSYDKKEKITK